MTDGDPVDNKISGLEKQLAQKRKLLEQIENNDPAHPLVTRSMRLKTLKEKMIAAKKKADEAKAKNGQ